VSRSLLVSHTPARGFSHCEIQLKHGAIASSSTTQTREKSRARGLHSAFRPTLVLDAFGLTALRSSGAALYLPPRDTHTVQEPRAAINPKQAARPAPTHRRWVWALTRGDIQALRRSAVDAYTATQRICRRKSWACQWSRQLTWRPLRCQLGASVFERVRIMQVEVQAEGEEC